MIQAGVKAETGHHTAHAGLSFLFDAVNMSRDLANAF
jgi:hypothetical protein